MDYPTNMQSMKSLVHRAREIMHRVDREEAEALIALGRLEQFMADLETTLEHAALSSLMTLEDFL